MTAVDMDFHAGSADAAVAIFGENADAEPGGLEADARRMRARRILPFDETLAPHAARVTRQRAAEMYLLTSSFGATVPSRSCRARPCPAC